MKQVFIDYFAEWNNGRIGRTRFFALSCGMMIIMILCLFGLLGILANIGFFDFPTGSDNDDTLALNSALLGDGLRHQASVYPAQFVQSPVAPRVFVQVPNAIWIPLSHILFANIAMKRLRDMHLPGGWFYLGAHTIILLVQFAFGSAGLAGLILVLFIVMLLIIRTDGFK